ncbi:MAG TPA: NAD-dependent epimerase/dehydratase family protein [Candidatus Acidoferrales bacterium]|nr:NAD-dependent epimerase/dehydratase family protein [Candidatus Acidoferrales bacterium]
MKALVIGGTRNLGPALVKALVAAGYQVTVFNRGQTPGALPAEVERLYGDRSDFHQLAAALAGRSFDLVVDTTLYNGPDAEAATRILGGRVGRYVFLSSGQVYLVRIGPERPFREEDYDGPVMARPPERDAYDLANWLYGAEKRDAEDAFSRAWVERRFPLTSLRLPNVNSERDHRERIWGYLARLQDGGPILVPEGPGLPLRHVYGDDVVQAVLRLARSDTGMGRAYNIGQDDTLSIDEFLPLLASLARRPLRIVRLPRERLEAERLLPACSPFSDSWMSCLDNRRSKQELGMVYTPFASYLGRIVTHYSEHPPALPEGYRRRPVERALAEAAARSGAA